MAPPHKKTNNNATAPSKSEDGETKIYAYVINENARLRKFYDSFYTLSTFLSVSKFADKPGVRDNAEIPTLCTN